MTSLVLATSIAFISAYAQPNQIKGLNKTPVAYVDAGRMMGRWYEIARIDNRYEKGLQYVSTFCSFRPDGLIRIANEGTDRDNDRRIVIAKAKPTDTEGLARISYFGPFYSDLRILYLDEDYDYVLVGSEDEDELWILSRTPRMTDHDARIVLDEAAFRGYDISRLDWILQ